MSATRFSATEKDVEKFIKFLALKSAQVVVQSRLGEKLQTHCNPQASGNDWVSVSNFGEKERFHCSNMECNASRRWKLARPIMPCGRCTAVQR